MRLEGGNAFTDPFKYRRAMYYVFWKGEDPPHDPGDDLPRGRRGRGAARPSAPSLSKPVPRSAWGALEALNKQIAGIKAEQG